MDKRGTFLFDWRLQHQNCVHWAGTNPHTVAPVRLYEAKVTVWCCIVSKTVFSPTSWRKRHYPVLKYDLCQNLTMQPCCIPSYRNCCSEMHRMADSWRTSTNSVPRAVYSRDSRAAFQLSHHLTLFSNSVASAIPDRIPMDFWFGDISNLE